jgi:hypothetical protein
MSMAAHIAKAEARGIRLRMEASELVVGGKHTPQFVEWVKRHKAELVAELRKPKDLNALLDEARAGTDFTVRDCRTLFSPLDLQLLVSGELTMKAAKHFIEHHDRTVCRNCLNGGCSQCDYRGTKPYAPEAT